MVYLQVWIDEQKTIVYYIKIPLNGLF